MLILAHMRSGSTLLHHLLLSHPDTIGCGERNATYRGPGDLRRLAVDAYYRRRQLLRRRAFAVDQINHTRFLADPALLNLPDTRAIFLIRQPGPSLSSMVEVLGHHYGTTLEQAVFHYRTRLSDLERLAGGMTSPAHAFFLTYEALVDRTDEALAGLSRFLPLSPGLTSRYDTFRFTGSAGDPSPTIHTGQIVRPLVRGPVLPAPLAADLYNIYTETRTRLRALCGAAVV